jgi:hypothetical protein
MTVSHLSEIPAISNADIPRILNDGIARVVCDPRGYSQHTGECGHDSFQQSLLFADGLKEITQPFFLTTSNDDIKQRIDETLASILGAQYLGQFKEFTLKKAEDAILSLKKRFINRYKVITSISQNGLQQAMETPYYLNKRAIIARTLAEPEINDEPKLSASHSCQYALESSVTLKNLSVFMHNLPSTPIYEPGSTAIQVFKLWEFVIKLFGLQLTAELKNDHTEFSTIMIPEKNIKVIQCSGPAIYGTDCTFDKLCNADGTPKNYDDVRTSFGMNAGHSVSIYKCNNLAQYYDDNIGVNGMPAIDNLNKIDGIIINNARVMPLFYNNGTNSFNVYDSKTHEYKNLTKKVFSSLGQIVSIMIFREKIYITKPATAGGSRSTRRNRKMRKQTRKN